LGGAAFIDLFAGPGLACDRHTGDIIDGSPLIALAHTAAPFSRLIFCEIDPDNVQALTMRTSAGADRVRIVPGDCNETIADVVALIPEYGLNIALIDPFGPRALRWDTIRALAGVTRMDFIIHFPTGPIKRNFGRGDSDRRIDEIVGTDAWRADVRGARNVSRLIDHLRSSLVDLGYARERVRSLQIVNSRNLPIYHLVYASRHDRGNAIWQSIARRTPGGQGELGFR
jgi:three-Cys-motif partner protein